jgi:hypothetical protein
MLVLVYLGSVLSLLARQPARIRHRHPCIRHPRRMYQDSKRVSAYTSSLRPHTLVA